MKLARTVLLLLLFTGCKEVINHEDPDADIDATGSGGGMAAALEPSPRDGSLEIVVITTSLVVALVPIGAARRRRRVVKDTITPHFS